jgi:hypothetical protein
MRNRETHRVCPNCGSPGPAEHAACDHCGGLTLLKSSRSSSGEARRCGATLLGESGPPEAEAQ